MRIAHGMAMLSLLGVAWATPVAALESKTSSLDASKCREMAGGGELATKFHCAGVAGYDLVIDDLDGKVSLTVVAPDGKELPLDFREKLNGDFPSSLGEVAEWRLVKEDGKPVPRALIVQFNAEGSVNEDGIPIPGAVSYWTVSKITGEKTCLTHVMPATKGAIKEARRWADEAEKHGCYPLTQAEMEATSPPPPPSAPAVPQSIEEIRQAARRGDLYAQRELGWRYQNGNEVPKDLVEAVKWYRLAADGGNPVAQNDMGFMYISGLGVKQNRESAIHWYRKAAAQGNEVAAKNLRGLGVEPPAPAAPPPAAGGGALTAEEGTLSKEEEAMFKRILKADDGLHFSREVTRYFRVDPATHTKVPLWVEMRFTPKDGLYFEEYQTYEVSFRPGDKTVHFAFNAGQALYGETTVLVADSLYFTEYVCGTDGCSTAQVKKGVK